MKRVFAALLVVSNVTHAGVILVDETKPATKGPGATLGVATATPKAAWKKVDQWEVKAGNNLRGVLDAWCERAGYRLVWNVESGFQSQGNFVSESEFKEAVKELFAASPQDLHLDVDITKNKLVIVTGGGQ